MTGTRGADWRLSAADAAAIAEGRCGDPFAVLGAHRVAGGLAVRAFAPDAEGVSAVDPSGRVICRLEPRTETGLFEGFSPGRRPRAYALRAEAGGRAWTYPDPYSFGPVLGELDDHLLLEGAHKRLHERLGAHVLRHEGVDGVAFAVWAPRAQRVSVVGDFNAWDGRRAPMRRRHASGLWEIFLPDLAAGAVYKFELLDADGRLLPLKADPFGRAAELRPSTASVVAAGTDHAWTDADWMAARSSQEPRRGPMSVYEVHLGSWRRAADGGFLTWEALADSLVDYAADLGFTHLELLPVCEHPLDDSWGYQPIGLFAPTRRFGDPAGFARFVDRAHGRGLGVILDWAPAHFPTDAHGLARFDGAPLYEHPDPHRGHHPDWGTAIYDYGRPEVANFLISNALYWLDRFHVDGLRVDAVASMLYLDYSRPEGAWTPNAEGGRENREAEAFLKRLNVLVYEGRPGVFTAAEESTSWPGVTRPVHLGGLGFGFKWNMGWMNDTLAYAGTDPIHRRYAHERITFGLLYAFTENFILPLSHDEFVHGKGSLVSRMPGDAGARLATVRAYLGFMWGHPGKKLLFMGQEFGQWGEWNFRRALDWDLLEHPAHRGVQSLVRDLNRLHRDLSPLHHLDTEPAGFRWIVVDDSLHSTAAWLRFGEPGAPPVAVACNFTPVQRDRYRIGLPHAGVWAEILNTDARDYGGGGAGNLGSVRAEPRAAHGLPASAEITLPPLSTVFFRFQPDGPGR